MALPRAFCGLSQAACVLATLLAVSLPARGQPSDAQLQEARELFAQASEDEQAGRWKQAVSKLQQVAAIKDTAGVRYHLAACFERGGLLVDALAQYERAHELAHEGNVQDVLELAEAKLGVLRARVPAVTVTVRSDRARVSIDGQPAPANQAVRLLPGQHQVVVTLDGAEQLRKPIVLGEGQQVTIDVPEPSPVGEPSARSVPEAVPDAQDKHPPAALPALSWWLLGAGALLAAGGGAAYWRADALAAESAHVCATSVRCDPDRAAQVRSWDAVALGLWVAAGAAAGTAAVVAFVPDGRDGSDAIVVGPATVAYRRAY